MIRIRNISRVDLIQPLGCQMGKSEAQRGRDPLDITQRTDGYAGLLLAAQCSLWGPSCPEEEFPPEVGAGMCK